MNDRTVGIVGSGLIADTHVAAVKDVCPGVRISVCDPLPGKAELLRRKFELAAAYTTLEEMLDKESPFSVHILSPPQMHVGHARQCLEAGSHVLIEKPLVFSVAEARDLYALAEDRGKVACVDHSVLYQPTVRKILEWIESTEDCRLLHFNCFFGINDGANPGLSPEHWKRHLPGGAIMDMIVHPVSLAVELSGKPANISCNFLGSSQHVDEVAISWRGERCLVSIVLSTRARPARKRSEIVTSKQVFLLDHSTESYVVERPGFGPRGAQKLFQNCSTGVQLIAGTLGTAMHVLRGELKQNPGARSLIAHYYAHLEDKEPSPISEESVINTTLALQEISALLPGRPRSTSGVEQATPQAGAGLHGPPEKQETVLVTGASGFLGRHVCRVLAAKNVCIRCQVRRSPGSDRIQGPNVKRVYVDFGYDGVHYEALVRGIRTVIHCAHAAGAKTWEDFKKTNVDATLALYEAASRAGCERFIFISSVAVYGVHQKGTVHVTEETPPTMGRSRWDCYIRSKTLAEQKLLAKSAEGGPGLLIIRPGILYSADGERLFRKAIPTKNGKLFVAIGSGRNHAPFTRVDVLAEAICRAQDCETMPEGIYNMTGDQKETTRSFLQSRLEKTGVKSRFLVIPAFPLRVMGTFLEHVYALARRTRRPKVTRYIVDSATRDIRYDCSKAEHELGWRSDEAVR